MFSLFKRKKNASASGPASVSPRPSEDPLQSEAVFRFHASVVSDVGLARANNEDNYILENAANFRSQDHSEFTLPDSQPGSRWQFAGVFDGMGGGENGHRASLDTAVIFLNAFNQAAALSYGEDIDRIVRAAFLEANNRIVSLKEECRILGTTGTVLCADGIAFKIYHLGDSRAYLARDNTLLQLTRDQTLAQMKREMGMYRDEDPAAEADRHKLTEFIGRDWTRRNIRPVESQWIPIRQGDTLLLCTDGLYDLCPKEQISQILFNGGTNRERAAALVEKALGNGGLDNITCVVVSFSQ